MCDKEVLAPVVPDLLHQLLSYLHGRKLGIVGHGWLRACARARAQPAFAARGICRNHWAEVQFLGFVHGTHATLGCLVHQPVKDRGPMQVSQLRQMELLMIEVDGQRANAFDEETKFLETGQRSLQRGSVHNQSKMPQETRPQ